MLLYHPSFALASTPGPADNLGRKFVWSRVVSKNNPQVVRGFTLSASCSISPTAHASHRQEGTEDESDTRKTDVKKFLPRHCTDMMDLEVIPPCLLFPAHSFLSLPLFPIWRGRGREKGGGGGKADASTNHFGDVCKTPLEQI